jgi:hypothetical protein
MKDDMAEIFCDLIFSGNEAGMVKAERSITTG